MIDAEQAPNQGQEATDSPLLGAFSLPDGFYDDKPDAGDVEPGGDKGESSVIERETDTGEGEEAEPDGADSQDPGQDAKSTSDSKKDEDGEAEGETISSVTELIESQQWDPEWFRSLKVPVKVDGQEAEATIKDLVDGYQMREAAEKRLEEAKSKAKTLNQEIAEKSKALEGQFATAATLIERAEKLLDDDVGQINWAKLREEDPAEYAAKKAEIRERRERIDRIKREAAEAYQQALNQRQAEFQTSLRQKLAEEQKALLEKLPEWRDPEKRKGEQAKLARYLIDQGFSEQDVMGASDHRLIVLAYKAMLRDEGQGRVEAAKKKVAKVPKVLKPGPQKQGRDKPAPTDPAEILYGKS